MLPGESQTKLPRRGALPYEEAWIGKSDRGGEIVISLRQNGPPAGEPYGEIKPEAPIGIEPMNGGFAVLVELLRRFAPFDKP
jgi:hypothetical protein